MNYNIQMIANELGNGAEFKTERGMMTQCPCHKDNECSLHLYETIKGDLRPKCNAGCLTKDIFQQLRKIGLLPEKAKTLSVTPKQTPVTIRADYHQPKKRRCRNQEIRDFKGMTSTEMQSLIFKEPEIFMHPILSTGTYMMIYAKDGVGKSKVGCAIAVGLTRETAKGITIGPWTINKGCGVVLFDTELPLPVIQKTTGLFAKSMGAESLERPLTIFSSMQFQEETGKCINLADKEWRNRILNHFTENRNDKLLLIDNISTMQTGVSEITKQGWEPINQFCLELRSMGVAVILIHHSTKSGTDRGHSSRRDNLDTVIKLERSSDTADQMAIIAKFEKARHLKPGEGADAYLRLEGDTKSGFRLVNDE